MSGVTVRPAAPTRAISSSSDQGSTTTPLPMIERLPCTTPDGSSDSL